jgi:hypothetical protein
MFDKIYPRDCREKTPQINFQGSCCASSSQIKTSTTLMRLVKTLRMSLKKWQTVTLSWMAVTSCHYYYWIYQLQIVGKQWHKNLHSELLWHFQKQWEEGSVMTLASTQDFGQNLKELQLPCFTTQDTKAVKFWKSFDGSAALAKTNQDTDPWIQIYLRVMGESSVRTSSMWSKAQSKRTIEDEHRPKTTKICLNIILNMNQTTCPVQCAAQGQHPISASLFPFVLARLLEASLHRKDLVEFEGLPQIPIQSPVCEACWTHPHLLG